MCLLSVVCVCVYASLCCLSIVFSFLLLCGDFLGSPQYFHSPFLTVCTCSVRYIRLPRLLRLFSIFPLAICLSLSIFLLVDLSGCLSFSCIYPSYFKFSMLDMHLGLPSTFCHVFLQKSRGLILSILCLSIIIVLSLSLSQHSV